MILVLNNPMSQICQEFIAFADQDTLQDIGLVRRQGIASRETACPFGPRASTRRTPRPAWAAWMDMLLEDFPFDSHAAMDWPWRLVTCTDRIS